MLPMRRALPGVLFLIGAVSISALPPFNGFMSELMIFHALFASGQIPQPLLVLVLVASLALLGLTSALAAACFVKAFGIVFLANPRSRYASEAKEVSWPMILGPGILAFLCLILGLFSYQILAAAGFRFALPNMLYIGIVLIAGYALTAAILLIGASNKTRISETWGCGIISQNPSMEYTASGFSEPIVRIFSMIYRPHKKIVREYEEKSNSIFRRGIAHIELVKIFEEYLYMPVIRLIARCSSLAARLEANNLDTYISYVFITVVILIILAGWWA